MEIKRNKYSHNDKTNDSFVNKKRDKLYEPKQNQLLSTDHTARNPVGDNQNSLTASARGPLLMQDYQLLEKLAQAVLQVTENSLCNFCGTMQEWTCRKIVVVPDWICGHQKANQQE